MAKENGRSEALDRYVRELAAETGLSEQQIRAIIDMIGKDRASIIREARILRKAERP